MLSVAGVIIGIPLSADPDDTHSSGEDPGFRAGV